MRFTDPLHPNRLEGRIGIVVQARDIGIVVYVLFGNETKCCAKACLEIISKANKEKSE